MQSGGSVELVGGVTDIASKFQSFGWHVQTIGGHDYEHILDAITAAKEAAGKPSLIVCRTEKGHGVPYMVGDNSWHKRVPTEEELARAFIEIGE
jgi:transketolase